MFGKSTIFNKLTGKHQHTGNWAGKTVGNATGISHYLNHTFQFVDIPGTYSLMSNSQEEEIARDYICFENPDVTVIVLDATCLERNLNLVFQIMELTPNIIVCVNLLDEAEKKNIEINLTLLEEKLGVPVVGTSAKKKKTLQKLMHTIFKYCVRKDTYTPNKVKYSLPIEKCILQMENTIKDITSKFPYIRRWISLKLIDGEKSILSSIEKYLSIDLQENESIIQQKNIIWEELEKYNIDSSNFRDTIVSHIMFHAEDVCNDVCTFHNKHYNQRDRKIDKILTSKTFGIPIMILFLAIIFWITIVGANYPSEVLSNMFSWLQGKLLLGAKSINLPEWLSNMLILGVYQTLTWIVAVMLPPMAIFFPLFTILEDLGYLPRIAFNTDGFFKKACCSRKANDYHVHGIWL